MRYNNTSATTCATMHREEKNGTTTATLNGTVETSTAKDDYITHPRPERTNYNQGGRLKFFKDGKFILELERAREGERVSWVSVPRKTFWPPQSTPTSTPTYRQESSTSLSVSDDNSSIQSSPWQRDHSWKQTTPQRNLSKPLCFYYRRTRRTMTPSSSSSSPSPALNLNSHRKCHYRRPYYDIYVKLESTDCSSTLNVKTAENVGTTEGKLNAKCEPRSRGKFRSMGLLAIVQSLVERIGVNANVSSAVVNGIVSLGAIRTPPRQDVIVSPRKRFLREMDRDNKVTLDDNCQKRSRSKQTTTLSGNNNTTSSTPSSSSSLTINNTIAPSSIISTITSTIPLTSPNMNGTSSSAKSPSPTTNSTVAQPITTSTTTSIRASSSYSITSLLADDRPSSGSSGVGSSRGGRKGSPVATVASVITNTTPSHGYLGFGGAGHPAHVVPPSVEERLYTENVDRLRSIELSHADKRAAAAAASALAYNPLHPALAPPGPIAPLSSSYAAYLPYHHHPALYHPHHYPAAASTLSPMQYAALYATQHHIANVNSPRPSPYPHQHHPLPYVLPPSLHPPVAPQPSVAVTTSGVSRLLSGLHHHHHHSNSGSVWTTPSGLRQAGATVLPPPAMSSQSAIVDLSRLQQAPMHHQHSPVGTGNAVVGSTVHNDAPSDKPLNLSKNAG